MGVSTTAAYPQDGYVVLPRLLPDATVRLLYEQFGLLGETGSLSIDSQVPGSYKVYGSPVFDALLPMLVPVVSEVVGREVVPTYTFTRLYRRGQELVAHRDRPACEHSMSLHIASSGPSEWPLWFRKDAEASRSVVLEPGDAVVYRGNDVLHWRRPLEDDWYLQCFLHFVDAEGPYRDERFDRRPGLGLPQDQRAAVGAVQD
ncbi:hypothetical protein [Dermatobacter hominis]|uniref:hypothetical protein n=1 Tax=Dermatobacter hominis TaxID=2884263 RepID=UPI001D1092C1|nr:hypothetical protein [Dermatobacter hominis]UDY33948.1 hypothetical protein LH044_11380 [Dermatobacter hominis]